MTTDDRVDLVILGGGSAGLVAAHGAAGMGAEVVMIEPNHPGGDCLWHGCVPSKRLLAAARVAHTIRTADHHGISASEPDINFAKVMERVRESQQAIAPHDSVERLEEAGVRVVPARGRFVSPNTIEAAGEQFRFRKAMIAVGARPFVPPVPGLREAEPLTSDTIWDLTEAPERLAVIGGGAIGCELGQAMSRLGSSVTILEMADRLLPMLGPEVGALLAERFENEGIDVRAGSGVSAVARQADGTVRIDIDDEHVVVDAVLVATGRAPNTREIGAELAGVELDQRGHVVVDDLLRTSNPHIYAGGDVVGKMAFTHTAGLHGSTVVSNSLFKLRRRIDHTNIPYAIFTDPEVAAVGRVDVGGAEGLDVHRIDHQYVDRAITSGDPVGFTELVVEDGKLVGATVVGETAGETINELTLRVTEKASLRDIGQMVRPYPTNAESAAKAANEVLREKFFSPRVRKVTGPLLDLLDRFDHPDDGS